jgi:glucokinase
VENDSARITGTSPIHGDLFLGIDVGGTDVKLGLIDAAGVIHHRDRRPTPQLQSPQRVFQYAMEFAHRTMLSGAINGAELSAVGLAVPGVLDTREYVLREVVNLPGWLGVPLLEELASVSGITSTVVNDANSAAYAEHAIRNLGKQSLALVTLGTGIGCGVVLGGNPFGGDHGCAGELGHIVIDFSDDAIDCTCGSRGHLESYAGAGGVVTRAKAALSDSGRDGFDDLTPRDIAEMAESGDPVCLQIVTETAQYIGRAIGLMGQVVDPAVVLLGGAMTFGGTSTATGRRFIDQVRKTVKQTTLAEVGGNMKIKFAALGNDAGMIGAGMVAKFAAARRS